MTIYTVYSPPITTGSTGDQHDKTVLIPDASALLALIFPFLWLIWHRLWWASLFYGLLSLLFIILLPTELSMIIIVLTVIPGLFLFLEGHELRRKMLERRGWKMVAVIEDQDIASAEYRYFYSVLNAQPDEELVNSEIPKWSITKKFIPIDSGIEFPGSSELS